MFNPIFDFESGSFIFPDPRTGNTGLDMNGDIHVRMSNNMSMDLSTGEMHINSGWKTNDNEEDQR